MVTKKELNLIVRALLSQMVEHQTRVIALQKAMEIRGDIPEGWVEQTIQKIRADPEYQQAVMAIAAYGQAPEITIENILRDFQGPIQ